MYARDYNRTQRIGVLNFNEIRSDDDGNDDGENKTFRRSSDVESRARKGLANWQHVTFS